MGRVEDKKQAILDAALRLISENGFHGTAMSKVAKEAGVSAGIIYHYFKNKDELIVEIYRAIKKELVRVLTAPLDGSRPLSLQIRNICKVSFMYHLKNPLITTFMQQFMMSPYYAMEIELEVREELDAISQLFEKGQEEMIIKDLPLPVIGSLISDVAASLARKQAIGIVDLSDETIENTMEALWQAIRK